VLSEMWGEDRIERAASSRAVPEQHAHSESGGRTNESNACHRDTELQISRFQDEDGASNLVLW